MTLMIYFRIEEFGTGNLGIYTHFGADLYGGWDYLLTVIQFEWEGMLANDAKQM